MTSLRQTIRLIIALATWTGLAISAQAAGNFHEHKAWSANCEVGAKCHANSTGKARRSKDSISFEIVRGPQANAPLAFRVYSPKKLAPSAQVSLSVDGGRPAVAREGHALSFPESRNGFTIKSRHIGTLLNQMMGGSSLALRFNTDAGPAEYVVSLSGLVAALRWVDDRQGRAGRQDALVAKGPEAPRDAPAPLVIKLKADIPAAVAALWSRGKICNDVEDDMFRAMQGFVAEIDPDTRVWVLPCGMPGAYNAPYVAYGQTTTGDVWQIFFALPGEKGWVAEDMIYNVVWDHRGKRIEHFIKGRGLGDCGTTAAYRWQGRTFELISARAKGDCDGNFVPPEKWPQIWPPK